MGSDKRVISVYEGKEKGPLVVALGAVHGNEPAGVLALQEVFQLLANEPQINPEFAFKGRLVGLIGNVRAYRDGQRFVDQDLNRIWTRDRVEALLEGTCLPPLLEEEKELLELLQEIRLQIADYQPDQLILLDLHTTSADGGIFSIPLEDDPASVHLATELHAPVILGLLQGLEGTLMHYASLPESALNIPGHQIRCVAFEAGQHYDAHSVSRAVSAIVSTLRSVGCIQIEDVDYTHHDILKRYSANLPRLNRIIHVHHIGPNEHFIMRPGYINFQKIHKGEHLATNGSGPILAPYDGRILMPLYQSKGTDGFFIVNEEYVNDER